MRAREESTEHPNIAPALKTQVRARGEYMSAPNNRLFYQQQEAKLVLSLFEGMNREQLLKNSRGGNSRIGPNCDLL